MTDTCLFIFLIFFFWQYTSMYLCTIMTCLFGCEKNTENDDPNTSKSDDKNLFLHPVRREEIKKGYSRVF